MNEYRESGAKLVLGEGSFGGPNTIEMRLTNGGDHFEPPAI
jgi:hypothetical protein